MGEWRILFSQKIYPDFPFVKKDWLAIAFDRDNYDNTRLPEWFFGEAKLEFSQHQEPILLKGYGERYENIGDGIELPFEWEAYRQFMCTSKNYSPDYMMKGPANDWAFWGDPETSVWGGEAAAMERIFDRRGGKEAVFALMLEEFGIPFGLSAYHELQAYLRRLVYPQS